MYAGACPGLLTICISDIHLMPAYADDADQQPSEEEQLHTDFGNTVSDLVRGYLSPTQAVRQLSQLCSDRAANHRCPNMLVTDPVHILSFLAALHACPAWSCPSDTIDCDPARALCSQHAV